MRIADALLPEYDHEMASTRKMLERVPDDKWGWKPHAKSFSMGDLATHIMSIPGWMPVTLQQDDFDFAPVGGQPYQNPKAANNKELLEKFDNLVADGRAALASADNESFMKSWALLAGGHEIFRMPRAAVVRSFVMSHIVHHRGQLSVYLRLNDIPVPGMYGPTADETGM